MTDTNQDSHVGFRRQSLIFLALNFSYSFFELCFNGVVARLPEGNYSLLWALLKIFFIVTAPLLGVQLVMSKEIASYGVLGEYGKRRYFFELTFRYVSILAVVIMVLGLIFSGLIADFLNIGSVFPVIFLFIAILFYFPIPIYYGVLQGLKKFYHLGIVQVFWGSSKAVIAAGIIFYISRDLSILFTGIIIATLLTVFLSRQFVATIKKYPVEPIENKEILHAYSLIVHVICMTTFITIMKNADVVFAKKFFDSTAADAYACAALVGSAFFMFSGIFLVMFPVVSEESTRGGNPVIFLKKSFQIIIGFSLIGLVAAWFAPKYLMYIITVGKYIPGAENLIKWIGFAIVPLSLVFIMSNYFLARHQWRFITVLAGGMIFQLLFILFMHGTPLRMLAGIIIANITTFLGMLVYAVLEHKKITKS